MCVNCAIATDNVLAGRPASALDVDEALQLTDLVEALGKKVSDFRPVNPQNLKLFLDNGQRGIIFGDRGEDIGHVFNVINENKQIKFVDGQTGRAADLENQGYVGFWLLQTN